MKREFSFLGLCLAATVAAHSQPDTAARSVSLEQIEVVAVRAGARTPMTYSNVDAAQIANENIGKTVPTLLQSLPSVVSYAEDGLGVGTTSFRVRGTDASRTNVTFNGMPLNNPESQEVFWIDFPNLSGYLSSVQLQRGIGTSTNGSAAFGASLSLKTFENRTDAYGSASSSLGSYNTFVHSVAAGSGTLPHGFGVDAQYSRVSSDGYIRNAAMNHQSFQGVLSHSAEKQWIKLIYMRAEHESGITWLGVSPENKQQYGRRYNAVGEFFDEEGNLHYYENETDHYFSDIAQFLYSRQLSENFMLHANVSYNHGFGHYEDYWRDNLFFWYDLFPDDARQMDTSDIVGLTSMKNDFYVGQLLLNYTKNDLRINAGALYSYYEGQEYGKVVWTRRYLDELPHDYQWYLNRGVKTEASFFAKGEYDLLPQLTAYADVQARLITYNLDGMDGDFANIGDRNKFTFINPKAGVFAQFNPQHTLYASWAMAQREPVRVDLIAAVKAGGDKKNIRPEQMHDVELGYKYSLGQTFIASANGYLMYYKDQLVSTGKLTAWGYKLMENVAQSYRTGIELQAAWAPFEKWNFEGNATFSQNKILDYTTHYARVDTDGEALKDAEGEFLADTAIGYGTTDISYSPNVVGAVAVTFSPLKQWSIVATAKYVSKQFYDNTSNSEISLPTYYFCNLATHYQWNLKAGSNVRLHLLVNNIFDRLFDANASLAASAVDENGDRAFARALYPQVGRTFTAKVEFVF